MRKKLIVLIVLILLSLFMSFSFSNDNKLKVGYYDDYPLVFKNADGNADGFVIDIIKKILENEDYQIEYVYGTWPEMLDWLKNDEIDLVVGILKSEKRDKIYDFNEKPLFLSWGKIFVNTNYDVESIFDLDGFKIGYLEEDYYAVEKTGFIEKADEFNLDIELISYPNYDDVLKAISNNEVYAGVINNHTIIQIYDYKNIKDSPIIFAASGFRVATNNGKNNEVLDVVDNSLTKWKSDKNSFYYEKYDFWFDEVDNYNVKAFYYENKKKIILTAFIIFFIILYSRIQFYFKIKELNKVNIELNEVNKEVDINYKEIDKTYKEMDLLANKFEELTNFLSENMEVLQKGSEEFFLSELLKQSMNLVTEADYGFVYYFGEDGLMIPLDAINIKRPDFKDLNKKDLMFLNKKVRIVEDFVTKLIKKLEKKENIKEMAKEIPISKESLLLVLEKENKTFGGVILEIKKGSKKSFSIESERIMIALKNIAESYFLNQNFHKTDEVFQKELIFSMVQMLEIHDIYTRGHSEMVARYSKMLAKYIGMDDELVERIYWAGLVHDIGKILISKDIINKKGKLTNGEYEEIKKHPIFGYKALNKSKVTEDIAKIVLEHHERIDGAGYPNGLKGDEISIESKIIAIADSYDAMTSERTYKKSMTNEEALEEIKNNLGTQFDYELGLKFISLMEGRD
ncbi:HD domain-containing protein [Clostridiaceae bacterium HSG29]|nr:HD domain-containing protein [Clostridiaceae bacterium HSG29]